ncbi:MAG: hypothetical protein GX569_14335 [Candidatus Riflebacteria bacterium]|nr:hypothetical protein [Candidatus Riflebacteria bacterium]
MQMTCENFSEWLNEGNFAAGVDELPEHFVEHVKSCSICQQALSVQNFEIAKLKKQATLRPEVKKRILLEVKKQIAAPQSEKRFSFAAFLSGFALVILLCSLAAISFWGHGPKPVAYVSGNGKLLRNATAIELSPQQQAVLPGDRLHFADGGGKLAWDNKDQLQIEGGAEFIVNENSLSMLNGDARIAFKPSARGYNVVMNFSSLVIVGTVLQLQARPDSDFIYVEDGKIQWQQKDGGKTGFLAKGQGLTISARQIAEMTQSHSEESGQSTGSESSPEPVLDVASDPVLPD